MPALEIIEQHSPRPRTPPPATGRAVFSRLPRGDSVVWARSLSIKFVLDGEERYRVGGRTHVVQPGSFLVVSTPCPVTATLPRAAAGLCLSMPMDRGALQLPAICTEGLVLEAANSRYGERLDMIAHRLAAGHLSPSDIEDLLAATPSLLLPLLTEAATAMGRLKVARSQTERGLHRQLERARRLISERSRGPLTLGEVADAAGMSPYHFIRRYAEAYGESWTTTHRRVRLAPALRELQAGMSVGRAATRAGFGLPGSFSRAFRDWAGISPRAVTRLDDTEIEQILRKVAPSHCSD
jgi:AraC family transcriptional regulator